MSIHSLRPHSIKSAFQSFSTILTKHYLSIIFHLFIALNVHLKTHIKSINHFPLLNASTCHNTLMIHILSYIGDDDDDLYIVL